MQKKTKPKMYFVMIKCFSKASLKWDKNVIPHDIADRLEFMRLKQKYPQEDLFYTKKECSDGIYVTVLTNNYEKTILIETKFAPMIARARRQEKRAASRSRSKKGRGTVINLPTA